MKRWNILHKRAHDKDIVTALLQNRGLIESDDIDLFLHPPHPSVFTPQAMGIDEVQLQKAVARIEKAIDEGESIVVYTDYDVDGITGGAIVWEVLNSLGAVVMPYVPHRETEGYGFSIAGIDHAKEAYKPGLIISVDHGITAAEKITYAKNLGIDVIVTDHHTIPTEYPQDAYAVVHTTQLSGAGVGWVLAQAISRKKQKIIADDYLALAVMGAVADLVPLTGVNRSISYHGLKMLNSTKRLGIQALFDDAGIEKGQIEPYHIGYVLGPRINAAGRLAHALDALRLLCTTDVARAQSLAKVLGETNSQRQKILEESFTHALSRVKPENPLLFVSDDSYHPGIIGLIAGRLTERFFRPSVVISRGATVSKASVRSIPGVNIVAMLRELSDVLLEVGGHPMAAGFSIETEKIAQLEERLGILAKNQITDELLIPQITIDMELKPEEVTFDTHALLQTLTPFGVGNATPTFVLRNMNIDDARLIGKERTHLKLKLSSSNMQFSAIGFKMSEFYSTLKPHQSVDIAFTLDENTWNGNTSIQLKLKDIQNHKKG